MRNENCIYHPFFSIIVPVYNVEKFLGECLDSILRQSFCNYEVIMADDGSTDSSGIICDKYAKYDKRFYVYHKPNEGLLATRIYGIERAKGKYIISLDSDDMLRKDALEIIENTITTWNADVVLFNASQDKEFVTTWKTISLQEKNVLEKDELYTLICKGTSLNNIVLKCFKQECLLHRDIIKQYSYVKSAEDLLQSLEVITNSKKTVYIDENLYFYRANDNSITHVFQESFYKSVCTVGTILTEYAKGWGDKGRWLPMVYSRNLKTCIIALKYLMSNCREKAKRLESFNEMKKDSFFIVSYQMGDKKNLGIIDRILIYMLHKNYICLLLLISDVKQYADKILTKK